MMTVTDIIASLALFFSIISLYLQWREKRPRLVFSTKIETRTLAVLGRGGEDIDKEMKVLCVYLSNPGEKTVHIKSVYLVTKDSNRIELEPYRRRHPPTIIEPHRAQDFVVQGPDILKGLSRQVHAGQIEAFITAYDELGKEYKSRSFKFFQDELLELKLLSNANSV